MWKRPCRSAATCTTPSSSGFARRASRFRNPTASRTANLRRQAKCSDSRQAGLSNDTVDPIGWGYEPPFGRELLKLAKGSCDRAPLSAYVLSRSAARSRLRRVPTMRQMTLVAFLQAQNCTNLPGSWRHPHSRTDTWSPDYYQHIGRVLEEGKFHLGFFDDRLSI